MKNGVRGGIAGKRDGSAVEGQRVAGDAGPVGIMIIRAYRVVETQFPLVGDRVKLRVAGAGADCYATFSAEAPWFSETSATLTGRLKRTVTTIFSPSS